MRPVPPRGSARSGMVLLFCLAVWAAITPPVQAKSTSGEVVTVYDGDTILLQRNPRRQIRVRLVGIDAPEKGQPFFEESRQFLSDLLLGKDVRVDIFNVDEEGNTIGIVMSREIHLKILEAGMAWYGPLPRWESQEFKETAAAARAQRRGLWATANPVAPWQWRARHPLPKGALRYPPVINTQDAEINARMEEARNFRKLAEELLVRGDARSAVPIYRQALEVGGTDSDLFAGLGAALAAIGQFDEAVLLYRKAVGLEKLGWVHGRMSEGDLQLQFALLLARLGRNQEAVSLYEEGVARLSHPGKAALARRFNPLALDKPLFNALCHIGWGTQGRMTDAVRQAVYRALVGAAPDVTAYRYFAGNTYAAGGAQEQARGEWKKALALDPERRGWGRQAQEALNKP